MSQEDEVQETDTAEHKFPTAQRTQPDPPMTPVQEMSEVIADRVERWMPSPFLFAIQKYL